MFQEFLFEYPVRVPLGVLRVPGWPLQVLQRWEEGGADWRVWRQLREIGKDHWRVALGGFLLGTMWPLQLIAWRTLEKWLVAILVYMLINAVLVIRLSSAFHAHNQLMIDTETRRLRKANEIRYFFVFDSHFTRPRSCWSAFVTISNWSSSAEIANESAWKIVISLPIFVRKIKSGRIWSDIFYSKLWD